MGPLTNQGFSFLLMGLCGGARIKTLANLIMIPLFYLTVQAHTSMLLQHPQTKHTNVHPASSSCFFPPLSVLLCPLKLWQHIKKRNSGFSQLLPGEWFTMGPDSNNILIKEYVCVSVFLPLISCLSHPHCHSLILLFTSGSIFSLIPYLLLFFHCFVAASHLFLFEH